ncbi:MAG: Fic family protein [Spirosomataceae bacterium]|jgi:Fic family protein
MKFKILPSEQLLPHFLVQEEELANRMANLQEFQNTIQDFTFYTSSSVVYSSKIEGVDIELDSYLKHKLLGVKFLVDYTKKADDLFEAYSFARSSILNEKSLLAAHKLITKNFLSASERGRWRRSPMFVMSGEKILYVATDPEQVKGELVKFFADLSLLLKTALTIRETFFYASLLHLIFLNIHPLNDGNGRTARLLEKWFLASKLGDKAWQIPSEKYYYTNKNQYYHNLQRIGFEYDSMDYNKALPFVNMLVACV